MHIILSLFVNCFDEGCVLASKLNELCDEQKNAMIRCIMNFCEFILLLFAFFVVQHNTVFFWSLENSFEEGTKKLNFCHVN